MNFGGKSSQILIFIWRIGSEFWTEVQYLIVPHIKLNQVFSTLAVLTFWANSLGGDGGDLFVHCKIFSSILASTH